MTETLTKPHATRMTALQLLDPLTTLAEAGALTPTSLVLSDPNLDFGQFESLGRYLGKLRDASSWWLGDWMMFGEGAYGERVYQAAVATGRSEETLGDYARVSAHVPPKRRKKQLTWHHHRLVAKRNADPEWQEEWLKKAIDNNWSVAEMKGAMKAVNPDGSLADTSGLDAHENRSRLVELGLRIAREANPLPDGRYAFDPEIYAQLRVAAGLDDE